MPRAGVIGSGIAGLASAIRLANKGYAVDVFEANSYAGGKLTELILPGGYRFDAGPSLFTLPELVDELFRLSGEDPAAYFTYKPLEVACRYFYEDGTQITAWRDPERFADEVARQLNISGQPVLQMLRYSRHIFQQTGDLFLTKSLHKTDTYLKASTLRAALLAPTLSLFSTLHKTNRKRLRHPKLVQIFDRFATYNGSSPYQAPGILAIIPHLEHNIGAAFPHGGMHAITQSLVRLAERKGVRFHYNQPVTRIGTSGKQASHLQVNNSWAGFDQVVCNMDVVPAYKKLLPDQPQPEKILRQERSSSALIFYWGIAKQFPELDLHNILFSEDYRREFRQIFRGNQLPDDPTVYIHVSSKKEPADAPQGHENWFVMINVPADNGQNWAAWRNRARGLILQKISRMLGTAIEPLITAEDYLDPPRIAQRTASYKGALYGTSSNNRMAAFFRHPNFSRRLHNLYFCGGSVHPGGGIPLCLNSARIVGDLVPEG